MGKALAQLELRLRQRCFWGILRGGMDGNLLIAFHYVVIKLNL
jgi:hypothetical protein